MVERENKNVEEVVGQPSSTTLDQLIERLKPLHITLAQNTYVRHTTKKLKQLVDDASEPNRIVIIGKERVGKTTFINALLGRSLLVADPSCPTSANTFIKYGERECVKAVFLDGMVVTFDIDKVELLTVSDTMSAQIIREHLDYLEIYVKHDLLKGVTFIDTIALEIGGKNSAYFSESLLERVDEVFWVIRNGSIATDPELNLLKKLHSKGIEPYFFVNATDGRAADVDAFLEREKARYGAYCANIQKVSAKQAIDALATNNTQLMIDSQITQARQLVQTLLKDEDKKTHLIMNRFVNWLTMLRHEVENIPRKEPYASTLDSLMQYTEEYVQSLQQRDRVIFKAYEDEYHHVSQALKPVQTLHQLLQTIGVELYLRDVVVEWFESHAILYHQYVRDYRKKHTEYMQIFDRVSERSLKVNQVSLDDLISQKVEDGAFAEQIQQLNQLHQQLQQLFEQARAEERIVLQVLYEAQNHINDNAQKKLDTILQQVDELVKQRKKEQRNVTSYLKKLEEFACLSEAQNFIGEGIEPFLKGTSLPLSGYQTEQLQQELQRIQQVPFKKDLQSVHNIHEVQYDLSMEEKLQKNYTLQPLHLTEGDIRSDLPELPAFIDVKSSQ